jgi:hypothetical protein
MKLLTVRQDVIGGQSKGCWLCVQIGFTMFLFQGWWKEWQGVRVYLGSPVHDPQTGYHCTRWGINRWCFNAPKALSIGAYA